MKKYELLSPAGNFEALKAAIIGGCDAIYVGGKMFGARAFSNNFSDMELVEAINYCHLYGVKIYVTVNTLIFENEVDKFLKYVDFLYKNNVDALIMQDLGMIDLVRKTYPLLEIHASTQMHIHNLEGVEFLTELGIKRVVLARETSIDTIKKIKERIDTELEVFVHGSLCVSYSGQCLMSSLIGNRSGNRGTCTGNCRLKYKYEDKEGYFLSCKDLNTLDNIDKLIDLGVESFKIEGRMKSPYYVYLVTKLYRQAIDSYLMTGKINYDVNDLNDLKKIFNREYTKGFLYSETNIVNEFRPNHLGVFIGTVIDKNKNRIKIKLNSELSVQDGIRFINSDVGFIVLNIFKDKNKLKIAYKNEIIEVISEENIKIGDNVVKTKDYYLEKKLDEILKKEKKINIDINIKANINKPFILEFSDGVNKVVLTKENVLKSINQPTTKEKIITQITKVGDTIYSINSVNYDIDENIFLSIKTINEYRREAIKLLNEKRLIKNKYVKDEYKVSVNPTKLDKKVNIYIKNHKQYEKIKSFDFNKIYMDLKLYQTINDERKVLKLNRVMNEYLDYDFNLLVGEIGSLKYKNIDTDFSLNVTNSYTVAFLNRIGINKITLSLELSFNQVKDIIENYTKRYHEHPNLEVIIYGKEEAMILKYSLNKDYILDRFNNKYKNIDNTIYNYKTRKIENYEEYFNIGVNSVRINLLDEEDYLSFIRRIYE